MIVIISSYDINNNLIDIHIDAATNIFIYMHIERKREVAASHLRVQSGKTNTVGWWPTLREAEGNRGLVDAAVPHSAISL